MNVWGPAQQWSAQWWRTALWIPPSISSLGPPDIIHVKKCSQALSIFHSSSSDANQRTKAEKVSEQNYAYSVPQTVACKRCSDLICFPKLTILVIDVVRRLDHACVTARTSCNLSVLDLYAHWLPLCLRVCNHFNVSKSGQLTIT